MSVRSGILEDLEQHAVGPPEGTIRAAGSTVQPSKSGRTKFTDEDDRILANWIVAMERSGGATSGNEIYKQLEAKVRERTAAEYRILMLLSLELPAHLAIVERTLGEDLAIPATVR